MKKTNNFTIRYLSLIILCLFSLILLIQCPKINSNESNVNAPVVEPDLTKNVKNAATQPYLNGIGNSWCRQASGNCGPTSFYMIFKYMGDYQMPNTFFDGTEELVGSQYDLRIDVTFLEGDSPLNYWLVCTNPYYTGGMSRNTFTNKLSSLNYNNAQFYSIQQYTTSTTTTSIKEAQFLIIQEQFLNNGIPVMIHLERSSSAGHFIDIVGCDGSTVYYMDPYLDKYTFDGLPITNNIPNNPILSVSYTNFIQNSWYDNSDSSGNAYWDGIWWGFYHDLTPAEPDTTAPNQVMNLTGIPKSNSSVKLSWAANLEKDLAYYYIYRNGTYVDKCSITTFTDTGLSANTSYSYQVSAIDKSSNEGLKSDAISVCTNLTIIYSIHVNSIEINMKNRLNLIGIPIGFNIYTNVSVKDQDGEFLQGVTVKIKLVNPDGFEYTAQGVTTSSGSVKIKIEASQVKGNYTVTVISLSLSNYEYDPSSNIENSSSLTISNQFLDNKDNKLYLTIGGIGGVFILVIALVIKKKRNPF